MIPENMRQYYTTKPAKISKTKRLFDLANSVPVTRVLRELHGIWVPENASGWKVQCPYGEEHSDGGVAKSMRVYPETNSAYCFSSAHGSFSPVTLWANYHGLVPKEAAKQLIRHYNLGTHREDYQAKMIRLVESYEDEDTRPNLPYIMSSVLPLHPQYARHQFDSDVLEYTATWAEQEFSGDPDEFVSQFNEWKGGLWQILDRK